MEPKRAFAAEHGTVASFNWGYRRRRDIQPPRSGPFSGRLATPRRGEIARSGRGAAGEHFPMISTDGVRQGDGANRGYQPPCARKRAGKATMDCLGDGSRPELCPSDSFWCVAGARRGNAPRRTGAAIAGGYHGVAAAGGVGDLPVPASSEEHELKTRAYRGTTMIRGSRRFARCDVRFRRPGHPGPR